MKVVVSALALFSVAACATAPASYEFERTRTIAEPKDAVWERVVEFFATNNLSIKTIEKDSGIIAAERMIGSPGTGGSVGGFADCGVNAFMVPMNQTVDLNVFVRPQGPSSTNVSVNTSFAEVRVFGSNPPQTVSCNSNGKLEDMLLDAAAGS